MLDVDINILVNKYNNNLNGIIPNDTVITGKINKLIIGDKYTLLDLSKIECNEICYFHQEGESIKNHILPNSLQTLRFYFSKLISLPDLPNSLKTLFCYDNELILLPNLPNSLEILNCHNNKLGSLPNLPNSLKFLDCSNNELISLPDFKNKIVLFFNQEILIEDIPYTKNIILENYYKNNINIINYKYNPVTSQEELNKYMDYKLQFYQNRKKSARK